MYELYKELEDIVCKENLITICLIVIGCYLADTLLTTLILSFVLALLDLGMSIYHNSLSFSSLATIPIYFIVVSFINTIILFFITIKIIYLYIKQL